MLFAVTVRMTGKRVLADKIYKQILPNLKKNEDELFMTLLFGLFLLLFHINNRKITIDHFEEIKKYFELVHDPNGSQPINETLLISSYAIISADAKHNKIYNKLSGTTGGYTLFLDWSNNRLALRQLLCLKSFFCRFSKSDLEECLLNAKIQGFSPDDLINIEEGMIGVVVEGSVFVKTHPGTDLTKPVIL